MDQEEGLKELLYNAREAVLLNSEPLPPETPVVQGYDWDKGVNYEALLQTYKNCGFQATCFGMAVDEIVRMLELRRKPLLPEQVDKLVNDPFTVRRTQCTLFLGYTSNMVSCGLRDTIRFLVQHKLVDCLVTAAGGIEEDLIKCLAPTYVGDFSLNDSNLRDKGLNRIANLLLPNQNYCIFETWVTPKIHEMLVEQQTKGTIWSPSKIIEKLGNDINDPSSICYWAAKNKIPIFCPILIDGSLGDIMAFHSLSNPGLIVDTLQDVTRLNTISVKAIHSGMVILGGGLVKHHICNANLMRNGADFSVYINTSSEFDGSDSGAKPEEAKSWGKIKKSASPVKVCADATLVFPLLVGETFAKYHFQGKFKDNKN